MGSQISHQHTVETATVADYVYSFLQSVKRQAQGSLSVRGDITKSLLQKEVGLDPKVLGCPSLFINPNPNLGYILKKKYELVSQRIKENDQTLKFAINLPAYYHKNSKSYKALVSLVERFPGSLIFMQELSEKSNLVRCKEDNGFTFPDTAIQYFYDIKEWREKIKDLDFSIGIRIHGNQPAFQSEVPALILAPDKRVEELARTMALPFLKYDIYRSATVGEDPQTVTSENIVELIHNHLDDFNAETFTANRQSKACQYQEMFDTV